MTAALDLASGEFRSLRREGQRLIARRLTAAYTILEDTVSTRRLLDNGKFPYSQVSDSLIVVGNAAEEVSRLLSKPLIPLLNHGEIDEQDPVSRQVCAWMIDLLLPLTNQPNALCLMTCPRGDSQEQASDNWTAQFLEHIVQLQGYDTMIMPPATPLALSELEETGFTGVGLVFGAEMISFSLLHHSRPIVEVRFKKGYSELLERYCQTHQKLRWDSAGNSYLDLEGIESWMASGEMSFSSPSSAGESWLRDACTELLLSAWFSFKRKILNCHESYLNAALPIAISGMPAMIPGFQEVVRESLLLSGVPIRPSVIRSAAFEPFSVARGLYLQGELQAGSPFPARFEVDAA